MLNRLLPLLLFMQLSVASAATDLMPLAQDFGRQLQGIGFSGDAIKISQTANKPKHPQVLGYRQRRHYLVTIIAANQIYLSMSFDGGKQFDENRRYSSLKQVVNTIQRLEKRYPAVKSSTVPGASAAVEMKQQAEDQRQGLEEAKSKKPAKKGDLPEVIDALAMSLPTSQSKHAGVTAQAVHSYAAAFSGQVQNCNQVTGSGVPQASAQLGEVLLATSLSLLAELGTLDPDKASRYFSSSGSDIDVANLIQDSSVDANAEVALKSQTLKALLQATVQQQQTELTALYPSAAQQFQQLKQWGRSENIDMRSLTRSLLDWIDVLNLDPAIYQRLDKYYPADQKLDFYYQLEPPLLAMDVQISDIDMATARFFLAAKNLLKLQNAQQQWQLQQLDKAPLAQQWQQQYSLAQDVEALLLGRNQAPQMINAVEVPTWFDQAIDQLQQSIPEKTVRQKYWLVLRQAKLPATLQSYIVGYAGLLPMPYWVLVVPKTESKSILFNFINSASWNQLVPYLQLALQNSESISAFPLHYLPLVAPAEEPRWHLVASDYAGLSDAAQKIMRQGWRYQKQGDVLQLHFLSHQWRQQWIYWQVELDVHGRVLNVNRQVLP